MKKIDVVVVNPKTRKIYRTEVESLDDYYKHLECRCFDVVRLDDDLNIYVDDEGLFNDELYLTHIKGLGEPLAGNLLFTGGVNSRGGTMPCPYSMVEIHELLINTVRVRDGA